MSEEIDFCPVCYARIFDDENYVLYDGRCYCPSCAKDVLSEEEIKQAEIHNVND